MTLHLVKLCVGVESIEDLANWQARRLRETAKAGTPELMHVTRQTPRRKGFPADSSIYWVIKGFIQVRQRLTGLREVTDSNGVPHCGLLLDPELVPTQRQPRRPFQGWRYLEAADAPRDLLENSNGDAGDIPAKMRQELAELQLL